MAIRSFMTLVFALSPVCGCAEVPADSQVVPTQAKCTFEREISARKVGPFRIGESLEALRKDYSITAGRLPYSDEIGFQVATCDPEASVIVSTAENSVVDSVSTASQSFQTAQGGKVGMNLEELQRLHPEGVLSTGVEEGGWIAFRLDGLSGFFEFSLIGVEFSCLLDRKSCPPEFYTRPSIRYWAR